MRCIDCDCCKKGWFKSKPEEYVCTGTKEDEHIKTNF